MLRQLFPFLMGSELSTVLSNNLPYIQCPSDRIKSNVVFFLCECICINYMCIIYALCTAQSMCLYLLYSNQYYCQLPTIPTMEWDQQSEKFWQIYYHIWSICFKTNWELINRLTLNLPIGKQSNQKFLGGDWRRQERSSVIGEKENLPWYWRRGQQLWVWQELQPDPKTPPLILTGKETSVILQNPLA